MYGFHMYYTAGMDPISGVMNMPKGEKPVFNARAKKEPESEYILALVNGLRPVRGSRFSLDDQ